MIDKKKNGWIKFIPSLDLPKERVSIAYATHDERGVRYAYGYFQFYNGTCGCFWKDGNEQPKVVKAEDIKYWMPVPSLDVQEEPVSEDLNTESMIESYKQRLISQANGMKNSPLIDMCLASYKHGINETLDTLNLSIVERTVKDWKEPISEDLGDYINKLSKQFPEVSFAKLSRIAVKVSRWQRNQDVKNKLPKVISRTDLDECAYDMSSDWMIDDQW